jgi:DNA-binding MarR family transcriptional regulator
LAWRALLTAHARLVDRLDQDLRAQAGLSLADYSALLQLAEAPQRRLRMSQLAEGVFLTRSGVTRLIDRLQADGLVTRSQCPSDGRGAEAVLTEAGLERLRAASPIHLRGIGCYFLDRVDGEDLEVLARMMAAVTAGLAPGTEYVEL